jgi:serine/threonine-protein kinase
MGEVWLATHKSLKTEVAVKFADHGVRSDRERGTIILERFLFEARISARLGARTKHIVAVLDAGTEQGVPYLVMEFVRGHTLDEEISARGPLTPERMAGVLDQVADALDTAHGLGVLHRDIKPGNVMVSVDSKTLLVKLADFGVAKIIQPGLALEKPRETPRNSIIGSPAYMSPEQLRMGEPMSPRSDLWELGVLVYEALTGELPFSANTVADLIVAITMRDPIPISKRRPTLGTAYDGWLDRALAKAPEKRFSSAKEMASAFRDCLAASVRRSPRMLLLGGAILGGLCATIAAIAITQTTAPDPQPSPAPSTSAQMLPAPNPESPVVNPVGPATAPSPPIAPVVAPPGPKTTAAPAPTASVAPAVEPTPTATAAPPKAPPTSKPRLPPKEFDQSEIQ